MVDASAYIVLIIGNDLNFTYLMQYYTRKSGRHALVSSPDKTVLKLAKRKKPAVIVLETDLGGEVDCEVLQMLKADQATSRIPVVICSWLDEETSGLADSAACYLQKPVLYGDFLAALAKVGPATDQEGGDSV